MIVDHTTPYHIPHTTQHPLFCCSVLQTIDSSENYLPLPLPSHQARELLYRCPFPTLKFFCFYFVTLLPQFLSACCTNIHDTKQPQHTQPSNMQGDRTEEEEPFLEKGTTTIKREGHHHHHHHQEMVTKGFLCFCKNRAYTGREKSTAFIILFSIASTIPQTMVSIKIGSVALLADSLCMWSDCMAYTISGIVFYTIYQRTTGVDTSGQDTLAERQARMAASAREEDRQAANQRSRYKMNRLDMIGATIGLVLLLASTVYITVISTRKLNDGATSSSVDGNWSIVFACIGAVVDGLSMWSLWYYSDPISVTRSKAYEEHPGTNSLLSVVLHLGADVARLFGLLIGGLLSNANPKKSIKIDAYVSLVICVVMYGFSIFLAYRIGRLVHILYCSSSSSSNSSDKEGKKEQVGKVVSGR